MRIAISRWTILTALGLCLTIGASTGCRAGASGWSTPSWLGMNSWSRGSSSASSVAQTKPSTSVPRPSTTGTPQAVASVAAGTNPVQPTATNPNYNPNQSATAGGYPSGTTTFPRTPAFAWNPSRGAARYELVLSTDPAFSTTWLLVRM